MNANGALSLRALVLAPSGRDAPLSVMLLKEAGFAADICQDLGKLNEEVHRGAGLAIIADEALQSAELRPLVTYLEDQPACFQALGGPITSAAAAAVAVDH